MRNIDEWLEAYGVSHKNPTNKLIHWVCVPLIMFSILGLLYTILVADGQTMWLNWATVLYLGALIFYARLSFTIMLGFAVVGYAMLWLNHSMALTMGTTAMFWTSLLIFVAAWAGQFYGHKIEGAKPSFIEDVQFLLIGPAWLLHFVYKALGIPYK